MKNKWSTKKKLRKQLLDVAMLRLQEDPSSLVLQQLVNRRKEQFEDGENL